MVNIILCGGSGTRLWPISRTLMPKQFVKLFNDKSLFQLTVERNQKVCDSQLVVSNVEQYFLALDQLEEIQQKNNHYLLEPIGRNTAPAITLACMSLAKDDIVLVTPSDHLIKDEVEYQKVIKKAKEFAENGKLVTFGITPTLPEIGFGYIEANEFDVLAFHEKPNLETAKKYLKQGNYFWNSGMFCFKVETFLDEIQKYSPDIFQQSKIAFENSKKDNDVLRVLHNDMENIPDDSIDYAVMEKSQNVKVIPADINWSDVGSFDSLYSELEKDKNGNTKNPNHIAINSRNNLVLTEKYIATVDIEDLIIVETDDALLISKKGSSQKVKEVVAQIKKKTKLHNIHLTAHRPWGTYTILEDNQGYKIKKILVKPNKKLSLQKHYHRNEHWIVVSGTATVIVEDKKYLVRPNESTYIKMGETHRLENNGKIPVVLIEVQVGEYTEEDDIIRIKDDFNR